MAFIYTPELIGSAFTYSDYRKHIIETLDAATEKMRPHIVRNVELMARYDESYQVSDELKAAFDTAQPTIWLVLTEGWCGDAAFNVPMMNALAQAVPDKIKLRLLLRDSNLDVIDANLTDGGRSIPKLVVLNEDLQPLGHWGPRPEGLQILTKEWKAAGLELREIIPKVHAWYDADDTRSLQKELAALVNP